MDLPNNPSDDVRRLNPDIYGKALAFIDKSVPQSKYHAVRTGHYASKKEARYADELSMRQKAGDILFWLEQTPFRLPGDIVYRLDFVVFRVGTFHASTVDTGFNGIDSYIVEFVEVKGKDLALGKLKRKQVEALYKINITVV
jgi:hypothetical protein